MGIIIAKFRKKKNTCEILEKLEQEITDIEEFSRTTENAKKKIVGRFIVLAFTTYFLLAVGLYFYYHRISPYQKLLYTSPLIVVPIVTYVIKGFLTWYYSRKIRKNQSKLVKLKEEKKKILEKVEETETYKVAKEILDKFGETSKNPSISVKEATPFLSAKSTASSTSRLMTTGLRQRTLGPPAVKGRLSFGHQEISSTPVVPSNMNRMATTGQTPGFPMRTISGYSATPGLAQNTPSTSSALQRPRPILPQEKTLLDKMFNYLVGDGPSNRYALICKNCSNHNGMALKEEFEYISFNCYYCGSLNPSRKKRLSGPKFEPTLSPARTMTTHNSDSDVSSGESEGSSKPVISEVTSNTEVSDNEGLIGMVEARSEDSGDSQSDNANSDQLYATNLNPFETRNPAGVGRNPFTDEDSDSELRHVSPMDYETIHGSEVVGARDNDLINRQEIED